MTWAHAAGNVAVIAIGLAEWLRRGQRPMTASQAWPSVTAIMVGILTVTGWLGGELAYRQGIGMDPREAQEPQAEPLPW